MIYIMTHKIFNPYFEDDLHYKVLHVGRNEDSKKEYLRDDVGDNISFKNSNYCELTGLYWIWKNAKEFPNELVGVVHYRRYFTSKIGDLLYTYLGIKPQIIDYHKIESKMSNIDIILPKPERILRTVYQSYADVHIAEDLEITRTAIQYLHPEYLTTFDSVMCSHSYYYANMMICKKETLDNYSEWLFSVLELVEESIDFEKYDTDYQKRVFGFLSERLLQVWVLHNNLKICELPAFNIEERRISLIRKNLNRIKHLINR